MLYFQQEEYTNLALTKYWHIEMAPVMLKHWRPLFDLEWEQIGVGPIWLRLLGLPLYFWSKYIFIHIGNALDTYLDYDKSYIRSGN